MNRSLNGDGMTVKEFIGQHTDITMNMIGHITRISITVAELLQGKSIDAYPGTNE